MIESEATSFYQKQWEAFPLLTIDIDPLEVAIEAIQKLRQAGLPTILPLDQPFVPDSEPIQEAVVLRLDDFRKKDSPPKHKGRPDAVMKQTEPASEPSPALYSTVIKPQALPRLSKADESGWLDKKQHIVNRRVVYSIGYNALEILAELEIAGGVITAERSSVGHQIQKRLGLSSGSKLYTKSVAALRKKGFVSLDDDNKNLALTPDGNDLIALLKAYPDDFRERLERKIKPKIPLNIIEYVMHELNVTFDVDIHPDELPDHTEWLLPLNSSSSVITHLARILGQDESAIQRRVSDMRDLRGYIETISSGREHGEVSLLTNIRVLKKGLEFALLAQRQLREEEGIIDEAAVEEAQDLLDASVHLAEQLGEISLIDEFRNRYDKNNLFDLSETEFDEERTLLDNAFMQLRQRYVAKFGKSKS